MPLDIVAGYEEDLLHLERADLFVDSFRCRWDLVDCLFIKKSLLKRDSGTGVFL